MPYGTSVGGLPFRRRSREKPFPFGWALAPFGLSLFLSFSFSFPSSCLRSVVHEGDAYPRRVKTTALEGYPP